jgi:hypothetical protein
VEITEPLDQAMFDGAPATVTIRVAAVDNDHPNEPASGMESVTLWIDGSAFANDDTAPYEWIDVELAEGMHEIYASGTDVAGNTRNSLNIHVVVFPVDGSSGTGGSGGSSGGDGGSGGCSVSPAQKRNAITSLAAFALAIFATAKLRRRPS